jgi:hypothetical protein
MAWLLQSAMYRIVQSELNTMSSGVAKRALVP